MGKQSQNTSDRKEVTYGPGNRFLIRLNPWDEQAFGFKMSELFELEYTDSMFLKKIDEQNRELGVAVCCLRHPANDFRTKKGLLGLGFYVSENALEVSAPLLKITTDRYFHFRNTKETDIAALTALARDSFRFSRFHEDPFFDAVAATRRYENWVSQLASSSRCYVAEIESDQIVGFFAYEYESDSVRIQLAGISNEYHGSGYFFFSSMLDTIKRICPEARIVRALVSSANLDILNVYTKLQFYFSKSLIDYHKRYESP